MKPIGVDGSTTSHGGTVKATQSRSSTDGKHWLVEGDGFECPKCKTWSTLIRNNCTVSVNSKKVALVGDLFTCGATLEQAQSRSVVGGSAIGAYQSAQSALGETVNNLSANSEHQYGTRFLLQDELTAEPLAGVCYEIYHNGETIHGTTDAEGYTSPITGKDADEVELVIISKEHNHE